eukprot:TRINITY_DN9268_c0_g1::TRINITY_DN9268_c0_g1_i1::g.13222::m.13222 TRINITY_DN9268_c0_g1::TRINITY_DN9268_c0_g1_i1::g.13222  ORF type:complete len:489 (-),score=143.28,sp/O75179/ANR17_HUMAN/29.88/3e-10,Ank_2/PF12796.2/2.6e-09,Ank_2/PF12796.2/2.9e-07,Ank_2/PF12796.2/2.8e-06,Ank_2/PF12796.2/4.2e-05,Ank/PF00023.25/6.6,Ank/PF00023.25/3.7,Ank/PF00023.25/0.17,Ank/PF00023.25/0.48,Ank/PF00023.25/0.016,Ank/PF00023.25/0.059,Ank/PF00023.25/1.1e+03,Ank_3/PF13606.1/2.4e+02,Ank_3/PF13606.1/1.9,Ank_3/PF13606.1/0.14
MGHSSGVQMLLDCIPSVEEKQIEVMQQYREGQTGLMAACANGHAATMYALLDVLTPSQKQKLLEQVNFNDCTALTYACSGGQPDTLDVLLEHLPSQEARQKYVLQLDMKGQTALMAACIPGKPEIASILLSQISTPGLRHRYIMHADIAGCNALMISSLNGEADMVKYLLKELPDAQTRLHYIATPAIDLSSPLMFACAGGHAAVAAALLENLPNNIARHRYILYEAEMFKNVLESAVEHAETMRVLIKHMINAKLLPNEIPTVIRALKRALRRRAEPYVAFHLFRLIIMGGNKGEIEPLLSVSFVHHLMVYVRCFMTRWLRRRNQKNQLNDLRFFMWFMCALFGRTAALSKAVFNEILSLPASTPATLVVRSWARALLSMCSLRTPTSGLKIKITNPQNQYKVIVRALADFLAVLEQSPPSLFGSEMGSFALFWTADEVGSLLNLLPLSFVKYFGKHANSFENEFSHLSIS